MDRRIVVTACFLVAAALMAATAMLLVQAAERARRAVRYVEESVAVPLGHLGDALEADTAGEALLQRAAAASGDERNALLSESIATAETGAQAWSSYQASALGLPGEADLASKYERDYAAGKAIAARVLVPIIQSPTPMPLPEEQILAAELDRQDLIAIEELYERERRSALRSLDRQQERLRDVALIAGLSVGVTLLVGFWFALRAARLTVAARRHQAVLVELSDFERSLTQALEFADDESDVFRVAGRAMTERRPDAAAAIVVVDATGATFVPIASVPSCRVESVEQCRAFRAGGPLQFSDSGALDSCPVLASGAEAPSAVACIPVAVAGIQAAVVQLTGPPGMPPAVGDDVALIARRAGDRITTMRALARFELQASRDPLTGLLNRRSLEEAVARVTADDGAYAVAFADLDHFKQLNDVHGHDAGDGALRAFASTLRASLRPNDLVGRWGGEEFVMVLPGCDQQQALEAMERVRSQLASDIAEHSAVNVTVSIGVAVRAGSESFEHTRACADDALRRAKAHGRDRVEAWAPRHRAP